MRPVATAPSRDRTDRITSWAEHQFAVKAVRDVVEALAAAGVDVLPVKGIVLAHSLYETAEQRPMLDVDLRVRRRDLHLVSRTARLRGWAPNPVPRQLGALEVFVSRTLVEFETTVGPPGICGITVAEMIERSHWCVGSLGFRHREPEIHDHALHLCVNVFKDKLTLAPRWSREDLLRIGQHPEFSARLLASRASDAKLRTLVSIVAEWLADDPRAEGWRAVRDLIGPPRRTYARMFRLVGGHAPLSVVSGIVTRSVSDAPARRVQAVALGLAGVARASAYRACARLNPVNTTPAPST